MSDTTGNTTAPADPSKQRTSDPGPTHTVGVVICWYPREPRRVGQVALCDPRGNSDLIVGRSGDSFFMQRPGEMIDCGKLRGDSLSREQLVIRREGDGARIRNVGSAEVKVNGVVLPRHYSTYVALGAVIEIVGHAVLLVTLRPRTMPAPHAGLLPLQPFGMPDSMQLTGESRRPGSSASRSSRPPSAGCRCSFTARRVPARSSSPAACTRDRPARAGRFSP